MPVHVRARASHCQLMAVSSVLSGELGTDEGGETNESVRVAPLVVVPGQDLDEVADDLGLGGVEDRGVRVAHDVGGDDRILGVLQNTLELTLSGGLDGSLNGLDGDLLLRDEGEVGQGAGRGGDADGEAVELALELGQDQGDSWAAPVLVGIMFRAAARARRRSLWGASRTRWSPV